MDQENELRERTRRIAGLIGDVRASLAAGKEVDDESLLRDHPELMPELQNELAKYRRVAAALAAPTVSATAGAQEAGFGTGRDLAGTAQKPAVQVPGYTLIRELGRGGQAVVYLATQLSTGRKVALKILRDGPLADERALIRMRREVQALAALNHPNIVIIIDTGQTAAGSRYIAMNYIGGSSLDEYMKDWQKKGSAQPCDLLRVFLKICTAVNAAHARGIMHRDLKPSNIRVDEHGEPHILDFGLARTVMDRFIQGGGEPVSITGDFLGSLPWSSPEQAQGDPDMIDIRTDVYSLGVILYQMVTGGRFPYEVVGNIRDVLNNILTAEPMPPSQIAAAVRSRSVGDGRRPARANPPVVNEQIERIVLKALAKKPQERYQSAGDLAGDVGNYLAGRPTAVQPRDDERSRWRPDQRQRRWRIALAAALLIGAGAVSWAILRTSSFGSREPSVESPPQSSLGATPSLPPADAAEFQGHHYQLIRQQLDWEAAAQRCRQMGGHLACPQTFGKQAFLQQLKGEETTAWVGGSADVSGAWFWLDGSPIPIGRIESDAQIEGFHRLFMMRSGKFAARPQSGRVDVAVVPRVEGFICEWDQ